jgi:hypothetical protein
MLDTFYQQLLNAVLLILMLLSTKRVHRCHRMKIALVILRRSNLLASCSPKLLLLHQWLWIDVENRRHSSYMSRAIGRGDNMRHRASKLNTVKPLYSGHLSDFPKISTIQRFNSRKNRSVIVHEEGFYCP